MPPPQQSRFDETGTTAPPKGRRGHKPKPVDMFAHADDALALARWKGEAPPATIEYHGPFCLRECECGQGHGVLPEDAS